MSTKRIALYAGSFDPVTTGHMDIIVRASKMFDAVIIGVGVNPKKPGMFTPDERCQMIKDASKALKNVEVVHFSGLTAAFAKKHKCQILVRGLRDAQDFGFEMQMAHMNRHLAKDIETVFIPTLQELSDISSSLVKEVALLGGNVQGLLPVSASRALTKKIQKTSKVQRLNQPKKSR